TLAAISHVFAGCQYSGCAGIDVVSDASPAPERMPEAAERTVRLLEAEARPPFFLWVHVRAPHAPYDAAAGDFRRLDDAGGGPAWFSPEAPKGFFATFTWLVERYRTRGELITPMGVIDGTRLDTTQSVVRQFQALYDANVRLGDDVFRRILESLARR